MSQINSTTPITTSLNTAKLNFDKKLDFNVLANITTFKDYDDTDESNLLEHVGNSEILITKEMPISANSINLFPSSVKLICEAGTGYNNIDIVAARAKNISVCNIGDYSAIAVAQLAITFILNFSCSMNQQQQMLDKSDYSNFTEFLKVPHFELTNKYLGVIGAGKIARHVINIARSLGMNILVYSRDSVEWGDNCIKSVSFEEMLKNSDFITIHCPLTSETEHLLNQKTFALMKPTAYLINTSRGPIIHEKELVIALKNKVIAGAGLDVQEIEPLDITSPLFQLPNVILTPHIGWKRLESRQRLISLLADNIKAFLNNSAINLVN